MNCRHCYSELSLNFIDLGTTPPSNSYLDKCDLSKKEIYYPLKVMVCQKCWLVQTEDYASADEIFDENYAYFSSTSLGWLNHAKRYSDMISRRLNLTNKDLVVEIASNDGYLLKNFHKKNIPSMGIEPTKSTANVSKKFGFEVICDFFSENLSHKVFAQKKANLIICNNVLAHVPDINDFISGLLFALDRNGTITIEFPHLLELIKENQFDTIYHEHFSYLSLLSLNQILSTFNLKIYDVDELNTHGGSLRAYISHSDSEFAIDPKVKKIIQQEQSFGINKTQTYSDFQERINRIKYEFLSFLISLKLKGKKIVGYGAAAKGSTLLNFSGVKSDLIDYVVDGSESKQGKFLPGSRIPIFPPSVLFNDKKVDVILILPWNIQTEILTQIKSNRSNIPDVYIAIPEITKIN